jgi:hypothetical protein
MSNTYSTLTSDLSTPDHHRGQDVTDSIRHITQRITEVNDEDEPVSKRSRYLKFTPEQLSQLIVACSTPGNRTPCISLGSPTSTAVIASSAPAYGTNAKYEEISYKPINPSYDGTPTTYVKVNSKTFDLTTDFTHVTESHVAGMPRWLILTSILLAMRLITLACWLNAFRYPLHLIWLSHWSTASRLNTAMTVHTCFGL